MTSTTFAAATALFIVSWFGSIQILMEISAVLLIGLVADILNTWLTNVGDPQMVCPERGREMNEKEIKALLTDWRVATLIILIVLSVIAIYPHFDQDGHLAIQPAVRS